MIANTLPHSYAFIATSCASLRSPFHLSHGAVIAVSRDIEERLCNLDTMPGSRPRWILHVQAQFWRVLMGIGMMLHKLARPLPPRPAFTQDIEATISPLKGRFRLNFYVPKDYKKQRKLRSNKKYPVVVNFHGGGFVLGTAKDDARWCGVVVDQVGAVVVSVDYRLAPELPFPTAVEDGADAILYLAQHAAELMLDPERFAVSGFSSGGNMSFTVPLCLQGELFDRTVSGERIVDGRAGSVPNAVITPPLTAVSSNAPNSLRVPLMRQKSRLDRIAMLRQTGASSLSLISSYKEDGQGGAVSVMTEGSNAIVKIRGIVSFYPPTDYTQTRAQRRATCIRADQNLPAVFTELFDDSYLQPPSLDLAHPWLSPAWRQHACSKPYLTISFYSAANGICYLPRAKSFEIGCRKIWESACITTASPASRMDGTRRPIRCAKAPVRDSSTWLHARSCDACLKSRMMAKRATRASICRVESTTRVSI